MRLVAPHKRTTTQRCLDGRHKAQVKHLKQHHTDGTPCWWCAQPMHLTPGLNWDGRTLQGDHSTPRSQGGRVADRLLHATCNNERGDGSRDHLRPALTGRKPTQTTVDVRPRALTWPW
ncbi:MAG: hypothetical protein J2P17_16600 [Mycobacterium sp.]|nr:hypothetical protein [Mycobacterium sp.]